MEKIFKLLLLLFIFTDKNFFGELFIMALSKDFLNSVYVSLFARPMDAGGYVYWSNQETMNENEFLDSILASDEYLHLYGSLSNEGKITKLYQVILGREIDAEGLAYWNKELSDPTDLNNHFPKLAMRIINAALNTTTTDKVAITNKLTAAMLFTDKLFENKTALNKYAANTNNGVIFIHSIDENTNYEKIVAATNAEINKVASQSDKQGALYNLSSGVDYADANYSTHDGILDEYFKFSDKNETVISDANTLLSTTLKDEISYDNDIVSVKFTNKDVSTGKSNAFVIVDANSRWENIENLQIISNNASGNIIMKADNGYIYGLKQIEISGTVGDNGLTISITDSGEKKDTDITSFSSIGVHTIRASELLHNNVVIDAGNSDKSLVIHGAASNSSTITGGLSGDSIYLNAKISDNVVYDNVSSLSKLSNSNSDSIDKLYYFDFVSGNDKIFIPSITGVAKANKKDKNTIEFKDGNTNLIDIKAENLKACLTGETGNTQVGILKTKDSHSLLVIDVDGNGTFENDTDIVIELVGYGASVSTWNADFLAALTVSE